MRPTQISAVICVVAIAGVALLQAAGPLRNPENKGGEARVTDKGRRLTRFSHLTSSVWRHGRQFVKHDLAPVPNNNPNPVPQPHRDRPERLTLNAAGTKLYITLAGTEADPGNEVAVFDVEKKKVIKRISVGRRPYAPFLHPGGKFLVVINELSNYATVIDTMTDEAVGDIPLDYYCQGLVFSPDGKQAWVANRYLDQVLVVMIDASDESLTGRVREVGGFNDEEFYGDSTISNELRDELVHRGFSEQQIEKALTRGVGGINGILRARCSRCHSQPAGGFLCGPDPVANFLSAVENSVGGRPDESPLLNAVLPRSMGGFGDQQVTPELHAGEVLFEAGEPELERLVQWIRQAEGGPGIPVGNAFSHPKDLVLSPDGRHLFVGNTGTMDVSVIDIEAEHEVGGILIQNVASHVTIVPDPQGNRDLLIALTMGAGFGAPNARDPHGAETWDRDHPEAQFTILRDPVTTDPYPMSQQAVMGPFDAIDGTWNFKMRDIQNDVVAVDLSRLDIPAWWPGMELDYLLKANVYESHPEWVRYTSDTVEATTGDIKGDIPPELQRVHGAFAEWAAVVGDRMYVTMAGTFEVVEWKIQPDASDPSEKLVPQRVFETGLRPVGIVAGRRDTVSAEKLFVANQLGETISIIDLATGKSEEFVVGDLTAPALATDAERGELIVHTSVFTSDGDTSCLHCHYRDTGDGRAWGAAETVGQDHTGHLTHGGTLGIPQMRNVFAIQPYYFEGTHHLSEGQGADVTEPASSIDFDRAIWAGDFTHIQSNVPKEERRLMHEELKERVEVRKLGDQWYDLEERREAFFRQQTKKHMGQEYGMRDMFRFVGSWLGNTTHLLPNPYDAQNPSVVRGEMLFNDSSVMCSVCHTEPEFTNKELALTNNDRRALPQLTTVTRRDASYTLASVRAVDYANGLPAYEQEPDDRGRVETVEGSFTTMQLRGIFDRPPVFLHHARARSLREVLCTPGHPALRRYRYPVLQGDEVVRQDRREIGFNETTARTLEGPLNPEDQIFDTHGGTSQLTPRQLEDLMNFMLSIE